MTPDLLGSIHKKSPRQNCRGLSFIKNTISINNPYRPFRLASRRRLELLILVLVCRQ